MYFPSHQATLLYRNNKDFEVKIVSRINLTLSRKLQDEIIKYNETMPLSSETANSKPKFRLKKRDV
jgi:hypothetical protein